MTVPPIGYEISCEGDLCTNAAAWIVWRIGCCTPDFPVMICGECNVARSTIPLPVSCADCDHVFIAHSEIWSRVTKLDAGEMTI